MSSSKWSCANGCDCPSCRPVGKHISTGLLILRVVIGVLIFMSWVGKFQATPEMQDMIGSAAHLMGLTFMTKVAWFYVAQRAEIIGWLLLILGRWTRLWALLGLVTMVVAMNMLGWNLDMTSPVNAMTPALFALIFLVILFTGPGKFSLAGWCCIRCKESKMYGMGKMGSGMSTMAHAKGAEWPKVCSDTCCSDKENCSCGDCDACQPASRSTEETNS